MTVTTKRKQAAPTPVPITSRIIIPAGAKVECGEAGGWGDRFKRLTVSGQVALLEIRVGEAGINIRITEKGSLFITNLCGHFTQFAPQNLENTRPWKT